MELIVTVAKLAVNIRSFAQAPIGPAGRHREQTRFEG